VSAEKNNAIVPDGYVRLEGSERRASSKAKLVGRVDDNEKFKVTISLRRRKDGPPLPDLDYFTKTPPKLRKRLSAQEFTEKYGAHPDDIQAVVKFANEHRLEVASTHAGRRTVVLSGTASQFSRAFGVSLSYFEVPARRAIRSLPVSRTRKYRDHAGFVHVPASLSDIIVGVFGLDNAPIGSRASNPGDPPIISTVTVQQVTQLYNFPAPGVAIAGQTIGIITPSGPNGGGYLQSDLDLTFSNVGLTAPTVIPIFVEPGV
jgi:kumamolisin